MGGIGTSEMAPQWLVSQLADSAFPTGGFAHSSGLEAAWQHGVIKDGAAVGDFVRVGLRQSTHGLLRFALATWESATELTESNAIFFEIDDACDLFLNNHIANRASRAQGRALLSTSTKIFPDEFLKRFAEQVRAGSCAVHAPTVFGVVCRRLGLNKPQMQDLFLFLFVRGCVSSAIRLGIIGPLEAQRLQYAIGQEGYPALPTSVNECDKLLPEELALQTTPVMDLLQGTQDRLYSKLFQS
jgi:urease accessory protein